MGLLVTLLVGLIAGWIAERVMGREHGLMANLIVGIVGSFIGTFLMTRVAGFRYDEGFNLATIMVATLGAVVLLAIFGGVRARRL